MIVIDASVLANAIGDDGPEGAVARAAIAADPDLATPDLADVETLAVLRKRWLAGTLGEGRLALAVDDLIALPLRRYPARPLLRRAHELRAAVTAYDAIYVGLAEILGCSLLTADVRLGSAPGLRCAVTIIRA